MAISVLDRDASDLTPAAGSADAAFSREEVLHDYRIAYESRQASLIGRREVLTGKAKFGIFGDGKEVAQLALAKVFRGGDFRSGYYRDQTLMFALGLLTIEQFFAQLYADPDVAHDPCSAGRSMNAHFSTCLLEPDGRFRNLAELLNSAADVSPVAAQMPRLAGLAYASRLYRELPELQAMTQFSSHGDEVAFGTIGNASCAEGLFWETVNAVGVLQSPMVLSIWDDGYGISVPNELQVAKDLSELLSGFRRAPGSGHGYDLYRVRGWDYPELCAVYSRAADVARREHVPAIVHVVEMTQPQGHSTSGSHERYKSKERLAWEAEVDCLRRMRQWMLAEGLANAGELDALEEEATRRVRGLQRAAWEAFRAPIEQEQSELMALLAEIGEIGEIGEIVETPSRAKATEAVERARSELARQPVVLRRDLVAAAQGALVDLAAHAGAGGRPAGELPAPVRRLAAWRRERVRENAERYDSDLYSTTPLAALAVPAVPAVYTAESPIVDGHKVMNACFDAALARYPNVVAIGEDVGQIGDVNQGFAGLQTKYGQLRVSDTGIREATIMGQAIGMALRGLRPIAEIQYLDYILYALQILSDDLACLRYRSKGQQKAPVIVRTRGHRLEGIWHAGSPMAGVLNLLRGIYVCVPRNMTQAAGFYNTLLAGDDPGVVVEVLNGYRVKERLPANVGEMTVPLGAPEVLREGGDVTVVTYGACCRVALEAAERLAQVGIEVEVVDVQTLLPFDLAGRVVDSLRKTNRIVFMDEDVPGGATAYMMQQVLEVQGGYAWLDGEPRTLPGAEHRTAYGSDGDYWSKPNREQLFETVYELMHEAKPAAYPLFYR
ncbi:MAG TPA: thiamine pyrophosphate-dependent enzyme [Thermoanaerobaculia bacterium]|jgi:pyruvate/2-oxoglutarate/acetoin dehydrogenase E1 component/TPP-dependent pyruvate/acetoin dehydrogenase alpha subunit|nr:thiamine pyrophosphate-dependent enzyme [Thermoanaerobaculia bacterium]